MELEDHFVVYVDFLGTSDAIHDTGRASELLSLLVSLAALRGEFSVEKNPTASGSQFNARPAVSTFSDHIVLSVSLPRLHAAGVDERMAGFAFFHQMQFTVASIAAAALRIGFLVRGGATIGKLYHVGSVVFGEAMVEAYNIEARISVYPRIVISPKLLTVPGLIDPGVPVIVRDDDGLHHLDYFRMMGLRAAAPGD